MFQAFCNVRVYSPVENFDHNEHCEHGAAWLANIKLNVDRDWHCRSDALWADVLGESN